jgi:hypothetical protein
VFAAFSMTDDDLSEELTLGEMTPTIVAGVREGTAQPLQQEGRP